MLFIFGNRFDGQLCLGRNGKELRYFKADLIEVLFKIKSRVGKDYALGQSHEEVITPLVKDYVQSYKDLPLFVYQIQNKYRDELRSKSGILRGREFGMKDMYSFHLNREDFEKFYEVSKKAYLKVFIRCGLVAKVTEASGGAFSDKVSYEFMIATEAGEDDIFHASGAGLYFNQEVAPSQAPPVKYKDKKMLPRKDVLGKGIVGVEELADYLKIPVEKTTKTLIFETEKEEVIAAAVRGSYNINEGKLRQADSY